MIKDLKTVTKAVLLTGLAFVLCLLGWFFNALTLQVNATSGYLSVKASEWTVSDYGKYGSYGSYYKIVLEYAGDEDLPNDPTGFANYVLDVDGNEFCVCDKNGAQLNLWYVSHNGTAKTLLFMFKTAASGDKIAYKDTEIDTLTIPKNAILGAPNQTDYAGILFADGLTLVKDNGAWTVQAQETSNDYVVALNATNVSLAWSGETLNATVALPFQSQAEVVYQAELVVSVNGENQLYSAKQAAGAETLVITLESYAQPSNDEIPCLTVFGGVLTDSDGGTQITLTGQVVFYEYVDGSWATEKYVQIQETVLGVITEKKLAVDDTYVFAAPQTQTDKLFCGWRYDGKAVQAGAQVALAEYTKRTLKAEAIFVGYQSITGASIRYDKAGGSSGIRFGATLLQTDFETFSDCILGVGMIVMPKNLLTEKEFTLENYNGENQAKDFFAAKENISAQGTTFTLYASIVEVLQANYNRAFCARAYLLVDNGEGGEYVWCSAIEQRSVYEVATAALERDKTEGKLAGWQTDVLEIYVNGVANVVYSGGEASVLCAARVSAVQAAQVSVSGNVVTLVLTTQAQNFSGILYNGKRVRDAEQSYENGVLTVVFDESKAEE